MTKPIAKTTPTVATRFEQVADERGLTRLDRPHSPAEAAEQDRRNREEFEQARAARFAPPAA